MSAEESEEITKQARPASASPSRAATAVSSSTNDSSSDQLRLLLAAQETINTKQGLPMSSRPSRGATAASSTNDSDQLRVLLAAQQLQGQSSLTDVSPSLVALLLQQQQQQIPNQVSPHQLLALLQQRQQQEQLLALQMSQLQQQQHAPHLDLDTTGGLFSGLTGGGGAASNLEMLMVQQQLMKQLGTSSLLGAAAFLNGADVVGLGSGQLSASSLSSAETSTRVMDGKLKATQDALAEGELAPPTDDGDHDEGEEGAAASDEDSHDTFPFKLYRMLMDAEKDGKDSIVSFNTSGKCFAIHKPRLFVSEIMPKYFTTTRLSSFQRQLNLYGYRRVAEGPDKGAYLHPDFVRGRKSQCKNIRRKKPSIKFPPNAFGYLLGAAGAAGSFNPSSLSVRQMIADGQLSAEQRILAATQQTNPALAAALLMEKQRQQADLLSQFVLRQHQDRELERQLLQQARENEQQQRNSN